MDITNTRLAQVSLGILDVTFDGDAIPLIDKEGAIEFVFTEGRKEVRAAGALSKIAEFVIRQDLESVSIPLLEAGSDAIGLLFGSLSGGGGPAYLAPTFVLRVQSLTGTLTAWAASVVGETTITISDEEETKPVLKFNCMADLSRDEGKQVWTFDPA